MASQDQSEEKTLPASKKKLDDARKRGQVSHSKDMVSAAGLLASVGFLFFAAQRITASGMAMFTVAGENADAGMGPGLAAIGGAVRRMLTDTLAPLFVIVVVVVIVANIAVLRGLVFAVDPVTPKFSNINPMEGLKKLFKPKALVEFAKSLLKMALLAAALAIVLSAGLNALLLAPSCGMGCIAGTFRALATPMLIAAVVVFLVAGFADIGLQRWLFLRDMRMGISEAKRERKEMEGDPHIRGQRKRQIREAATSTARLGIARASLLLHVGADLAVGLRFRRGETPVPVVVCRGRGPSAARLIAEAGRLNLPLVEERELVPVLLKRTQPGAYIPETTYQAAAMALSRAGLV
jgi:type III secretion protein U